MKRFLSLFILSILLPVFTASASSGSSTDAALQFLQQAGLAVTVTGTDEKELRFALPGGGSGRCYTYGLKAPYQMNWQFDSIINEEMALFLDGYLGLLAQVEQGLATEEHLHPDYHKEEGLGQRNIEVTVSNALLYIENLEDPWLQVLLHQLSLHDGNDALNSLRARLASRMLGKLDLTPVDPREGCAWYDALTLSVQDALPPVDAALYVNDPLLARLTQEMIAWTDDRKAGWGNLRDVDKTKTRNIVRLTVGRMEENQNTLTLWAVVSESEYALYDSCRYQSVSGSWVPHRLTYIKDDHGAWRISEVIGAGDGTEYYPSILAFCNGDEALAASLLAGNDTDTDPCFFRYLQHHGYPVPEEIPY